jgi:hypothetical protein
MMNIHNIYDRYGAEMLLSNAHHHELPLLTNTMNCTNTYSRLSADTDQITVVP